MVDPGSITPAGSAISADMIIPRLSSRVYIEKGQTAYSASSALDVIYYADMLLIGIDDRATTLSYTFTVGTYGTYTSDVYFMTLTNGLTYASISEMTITSSTTPYITGALTGTNPIADTMCPVNIIEDSSICYLDSAPTVPLWLYVRWYDDGTMRMYYSGGASNWPADHTVTVPTLAVSWVISTA